MKIVVAVNKGQTVPCRGPKRGLPSLQLVFVKKNDHKYPSTSCEHFENAGWFGYRGEGVIVLNFSIQHVRRGFVGWNKSLCYGFLSVTKLPLTEGLQGSLLWCEGVLWRAKSKGLG